MKSLQGPSPVGHERGGFPIQSIYVRILKVRKLAPSVFLKALLSTKEKTGGGQNPVNP
jgi:hypothetical protein